uniref:NAD(+) ADP-ribosyltransferase n=1 Tax=Angiostrongylus cantonensis TaxID=6313 RepID=A0A0K0DCH5_ANGCA
MSVRVRFSSARPGVAYVSPPGEQDNTDGALVTEILSKPMPPLHQEDNFRMDAHTAASIGDVANLTLNENQTLAKEHLQALIASKKLDPNAKNLSEWTPLLYAAYLGHHNVCTALIDAGAKLDDCNLKGQTALMMASACGNLQVTNILKDRLEALVGLARILVVRLLLERGASVNRADSQDRQALHYSSSCSQNVVTDALLQAGADPNAPDIEGMTPMLEACSSGHELTICSLLEYGGDPLLRNCRGEDCQALAGEDPKIQQLLTDNIKRRSSSGFNNESPRTRRPRTLDDLLEGMNLSRLSEKFKSENIDLNLFFDLTEKDFEEMGIAYGPKKRMLTVIDQYRKSGQISYEPLEVELAHSPTFTAVSVYYKI